MMLETSKGPYNYNCCYYFLISCLINHFPFSFHFQQKLMNGISARGPAGQRAVSIVDQEECDFVFAHVFVTVTAKERLLKCPLVTKPSAIVSNISNTRDSVSSDFQTPRLKELQFEVFGNQTLSRVFQTYLLNREKWQNKE